MYSIADNQLGTLTNVPNIQKVVDDLSKRSIGSYGNVFRNNRRMCEWRIIGEWDFFYASSVTIVRFYIGDCSIDYSEDTCSFGDKDNVIEILLEKYWTTK